MLRVDAYQSLVVYDYSSGLEVPGMSIENSFTCDPSQFQYSPRIQLQTMVVWVAFQG